jgi:hypothetical protein
LAAGHGHTGLPERRRFAEIALACDGMFSEERR